ncbi:MULTISPECIES: pseudouridine-5'-phosphate glycosidase [unclassified Rathayibacter]|uniref:pseudouridine-5'-phosphate glycosidase n=1 Tax=unclassified Rathayibacter TaxID=2609250 RepID=UPI000CE77DC0|nr:MULTISPECIES: pseudouridine-5'-phosphate glycosidase [unclassified Rathayibacter]PPG04765.1 pseudouridine-5-phosphate glycosidase [Rathayibacter sp. AY2B1]PPG68462.1 pseudouridine-5-phosphate glycosidase [Rathayibacter sp. AY1F4]
MTSTLRISTEVQEAVAAGKPVLALESTIFTHGLPRPRNFEVATESEKQLRAAGVTPATIGVVNGELVIGLSTAEIEQLSNDDTVVKASIRDLPIVAAKKLSAGTTVAATAYAAHRAGIKVFSTGGLGGVHQGASETFDESADLGALAALPIVVISAGVKSILDIGLTLERLETLNVPVIGWKTTDYPGFYITDSGYDIDYAVDTTDEIAEVVAARDALQLNSTVLVANPIPADKQLSPDTLEKVLTSAHGAAADANIVGHDTTPFLLDYIQKATNGESLEVNIDVYRNNVQLGAEIAKSISAR